ncbi:MAG: hypothetical protein JXR76_22465, partial [Deltaproteobacteria bacterium]|nr:hypothetical protein [Deltaproteobacteria bacterium]
EYNSKDVPTADGNVNGNIRFGQPGYMIVRVALHEIAHTLGIGTSSEYRNLIADGVFTGATATALLKELDNDPNAVLKGDQTHFWPYGLNKEGEFNGEEDGIKHCKIVRAILVDMGWVD